ncbi:hypothetical protein NQ314_020278 [Rhamnusium bicolor]|uniref:Uncharacterized protein n=1 Tax=Rhamnusium bicolor TaxID=1586634 RepID=A0AAV8WM46_9CUCU|nr:hypothetical protein NQ314_020278 [Rhamnusium bicolor]
MFKPQLGEIAIEASEIVSRLEQVADGIPIVDNAYNQSTVFLGLEKKHTDEIIQVIHGLISTDEDGEPLTFPSLDGVTKLVMVSHSLAAYCGGLERPILQKLSTRFTTDTTRWISQIFGYALAIYFIFMFIFLKEKILHKNNKGSNLYPHDFLFEQN